MCPLPIPKGAWQNVTMDFIEGLPKSEGSNAILVVVDRFTKYAHFFALKHPFTAVQVAKVFQNNVVKLHGISRIITSDRERIFTSTFWKELFKLIDTKLQMSTSYHIQTDGQSERVNQCLEMYLRCVVQETPTKWYNWLPLAEYWYNTSYHTTLGCTPYKAPYGIETHHGLIPDLSLTNNQNVVDMLTEREAYSEFLKQHLAKA